MSDVKHHEHQSSVDFRPTSAPIHQYTVGDCGFLHEFFFYLLEYIWIYENNYETYLFDQRWTKLALVLQRWNWKQVRKIETVFKFWMIVFFVYFFLEVSLFSCIHKFMCICNVCRLCRAMFNCFIDGWVEKYRTKNQRAVFSHQSC